jgi:nucleoside-diphosphate-sugar epimerase
VEAGVGRRVFVTGGTGFVGSHVVDRLLEDGFRVRLLFRPRPGRPAPERPFLEVHSGDLRDARSLDAGLRGVDCVCHVGGLIKAARRAEYFDVNAEGTARLARAARDAGVRRFVLVSSLAAAGPATGSEPRDESSAEKTVSVYGESKREGELRVAEILPGDRSVVLRPPIVYGPRDFGLLPLFQAAARNIMPLLGFGPRHYSIIHVRDLAKALSLSLSSDRVAGKTLFVASRERLEQRTLLAHIAAAVGRRPFAVRIPISLLAVPAAAGSLVGLLTGRAAMLSLAKIPEIAARNWTCSGERAEALLSFSCSVSLEAGLAETVAWYRARGLLRGGGAVSPDSADVSGARAPL